MHQKNLLKFSKENAKLCPAEHLLASVQMCNRLVKANFAEKNLKVLLELRQQNDLTIIKSNYTLD